MHGHNWNVSCFLPCKSYIWYFMVGEPPTSSIQWIRTWKWRIHTSPSWWWSEQIFFLLCLFCIVFPCNKKTGSFSRNVYKHQQFHKICSFFFSASDSSWEADTWKRMSESNTAQGKQGDGRTVIYNFARHGWQTGTMRGKERWWGL